MKATDFTDGFPGTIEPISGGAVAFHPNPLPPGLQLGRAIREANDFALLALGELRAAIPSLPNPDLITKPFLRREAVLSSRIEGTYTELEQLCLFEVDSGKQRRDNLSEADQDAREVLNYVEALEYGLAQLDGLPICNRLMKSMHARLLDGVRGTDNRPGEFRNVQNLIGRDRDFRKARFVPPPAVAVEKCMRDLETYINNPDDSFPVLVRIALVHYQLEAIHPFRDGNGRVGRLLISLLLAAYGILPQPLLYLSAYFERNRDRYVEHLWQVSRRGAWNEWVLFFLEGVKTEAEDASRRARRLLDLQDKYRAAAQSRGSGALVTLVDCLFDSPMITVPIAMKLLKMTYNGARGNIDKLCEDGILVGSTSRKRNRIYTAFEIIKVLGSDDV
jgi:Fic family protein